MVHIHSLQGPLKQWTPSLTADNCESRVRLFAFTCALSVKHRQYACTGAAVSRSRKTRRRHYWEWLGGKITTVCVNCSNDDYAWNAIIYFDNWPAHICYGSWKLKWMPDILNIVLGACCYVCGFRHQKCVNWSLPHN